VKSVNTHLQWVAILKCFLLGLATHLLADIFLKDSPWLSSAVGSMGWLIGIWITRAFRDKQKAAIALIHSHNEDAEYSLDLFDRNDLNIAGESFRDILDLDDGLSNPGLGDRSGLGLFLKGHDALTSRA
ncbi:hypothetical protein, partial [Parvibaculum sp.]|uniref:hypothetical protein n=1 Tax=Parvibaculum sp. TaxID=2024848 RepID=UPI002BBAE4AE